MIPTLGDSRTSNNFTHDTMAEEQEDTGAALATTHKLKLRPPTYDGNYATYEVWRYRCTAYMGLQDTFYPRMFNLAEQSAQQLTEAHLGAAAATLEGAGNWVQLHQNLKGTRSRSHSLQTAAT